MSRAERTLRVLPLTILLLTGAVLTIGLVASRADAHGSTQRPASRVFTCRFENPNNPMCADAWSANSQALYDWMEVNIGDAAGRHRELIPDGQLCSAGRSKYAAFDRPGAWPVTALQTDGSGTVELRYQNTAPHATQYYRVYLTRSGFDARTDTLRWDDLELVHDTGPMGRESVATMRPALPARSVPAVLYVVWQRSDSPEAFYACSDVTVNAGSAVPPATTSPPPPPTTAASSTRPSTAPSTAPSTRPTAAPTTAAPTTSTAPTSVAPAPAPSAPVSSTAAAVDPPTSAPQSTAPPITIASSSTVAQSPTAPTAVAPSATPSTVATVEDEVPSTITAGASSPSTASASTGGTTTGPDDAGSAVPAAAGPGSSSTAPEGVTVRADATGPSVASGPAEGGAGVTNDGELAQSGSARTGDSADAGTGRGWALLGLGVLASAALALLGLALHWSGGTRRMTDAALRWVG